MHKQLLPVGNLEIFAYALQWLQVHHLNCKEINDTEIITCISSFER